MGGGSGGPKPSIVLDGKVQTVAAPEDVNDTEGNGTYGKVTRRSSIGRLLPATWATAGAETTPLKIVDSSNPGWNTDNGKASGYSRRTTERHNRINDTTIGNTM